MSETTPASSQNKVNNSSHLKSSRTSAAGVDLPPVVITPSLMLWRIQLLVYSVMFLSASCALFPFLRSAFYWPMVWLSFVCLLIFTLRLAWLSKQKAPIRFSVSQKVWRLQTAGGEVQVKPCDDIILWEHLIVLPVREVLTHRKYRVVALTDSMSAEDWRRLRVWLRMGM